MSVNNKITRKSSYVIYTNYTFKQRMKPCNNDSDEFKIAK